MWKYNPKAIGSTPNENYSFFSEPPVPLTEKSSFLCIHQAPVVQTLDTIMRRINQYPAYKY